MKKLASYLILIMPIVALSSNPARPGLSDESVAVTIDSMIYLLFTAGVLYGGYIIFKRK